MRKGSDKLEPWLLPLVTSFNLLPFSYAHKSWIKTLCPSPPEHPVGTRGQRRLSEIMLYQLGLDEDFFWDFSDIHYRIALLPTNTLQELVELAGAACYWKAVITAVTRNAVQRIKEILGERLHTFCVERAPLMVPETVSKDRPPHSKEETSKLGMQLIAAVLSKAPPALVKRVQLKFPQGSDFTSPSGDTAIPQDSALFILKRILLFEVDPSWTPLFKR